MDGEILDLWMGAASFQFTDTVASPKRSRITIPVMASSSAGCRLGLVELWRRSAGATTMSRVDRSCS